MLRKQACLSQWVLSQFRGLAESSAAYLLGSGPVGTLAWATGHRNSSYGRKGRISLRVAERATNCDTRVIHDIVYEKRSFGVARFISFVEIFEVEGYTRSTSMAKSFGYQMCSTEKGPQDCKQDVDFRSRRTAAPNIRIR